MKKRRLLNRILTFALAAVLFFALLPAGFSYAEDTGTPEEYIPVKQDAAALYAATGKKSIVPYYSYCGFSASDTA